jgi:serine phosphatase RsbU (regulator of sigma subunit)
MTSSLKNTGIKFWSRLRTRMAVSYVAVTLVIVLLLESFVIGVVLYAFTRSQFAGYLALTRADHAAQLYALQAAVQADRTALDPNTTFEPGQDASIGFEQEGAPPENWPPPEWSQQAGSQQEWPPQEWSQQEWPAGFSFFGLSVPYIEPGASAPNRPAFALLIDPAEQVLTSSYPDRYPAAMNPTQELSEDLPLIRSALAGNPDSAIRDTPQGRVASVARTIWSRDREPLGAVYIQAPAGGLPDTSFLTEVAGFVIPSAILWLCLMLPVGLLFGFLTTRGLIRRIERLAGATAQFTKGDTAQRVPVSRPDEIGQLEGQFNQMAEQLVDSFEQRQALAEQSARREERARIEQELTSACYIQQSLLPEAVPSIPGWQIEPFYRPAREVGGDLYDFLALPDGRLGIVIGDVTGKGMPAALIMATTCAMIRSAAPGIASPGEVLSWVNNLLEGNIASGTFATCFYAVLEPGSGRLRFANAGHSLPYLARDGEIHELRATGLPLGLLAEQSYPEQEVTLTADDRILFYTDGLVEAHAPDREMFGTPRLKRLLQEHSHAAGLLEFLLNRLEEFTGAGWEQEDDVTLVMVRRTGRP